MKNKVFSTFIFCSIILSSCGVSNRNHLPKQPDSYTRNYKYGPYPRNKMDVYIPHRIDESMSVVLLIHGGGWVIGQKFHIWNIYHHLRKQGYLCANMQYRLVNKKIKYWHQLEDIGNAVKILQKISKSNGGSNKVILIGESAGGHLALLYGYGHPEQVSKIISMSGPTDLYSDKYLKSNYYGRSHRIFELITGSSYDSVPQPEIFKKASPVANVANVPTLHFQGDKDFLVNEQQGLMLDSVLTARGVSHKFVYLKGSGHLPRFIRHKRNKIIFPAIDDFIRN